MVINMKIPIISVIFIIISLSLLGCSDNDINDTLPPSEPTPTMRPLPDYEFEEECAHFWKDPDCDNPYICFDCGDTTGLPLEHIWMSANFQEPSICELCGEISGEPIEPYFSVFGYRINTTAGRPFQYKTITNRDPDKETIGEATLMYVDIFESSAEYPEKLGYEYIVTRLMITFEDESARTDGFQYLTGHLDFFGFDPDEPLAAHNDLRDSDIENFKVANRELNFFGEYYEYYVMHTQISNVWVDNISYLILEYAFLVPATYDGIVIYLSNAANWSETDNKVISDNFDDNTLFFRLRTQTS